MTSLNEVNCGAAGEIRTPEVRHHWISNPAQWPGYATAADKAGDRRSSDEHDGGGWMTYHQVKCGTEPSKRSKWTKPRRRWHTHQNEGEVHPSEIIQRAEEGFRSFWHAPIFIKFFQWINVPN